MLQFFSLSVLFIFLFLTSAFANDIQLTLSHYSIDDHVTLVVENNSLEKVKIVTVYIEFDHQNYEHLLQEIILPQQKQIFHFDVRLPDLPGSYPLVATVSYFNEGKILSLKHVAMFNFQESAGVDSSCFAGDTNIEEEGNIIIRADQPELWNLVLPEEIDVLSISTFTDCRVFHIKTKFTGFRNKYPFFAVAETVIGGKHHAAICGGTLCTGYSNVISYNSSNRGKISSNVLLVQVISFLCASYYILTRQKPETRFSRALGKYTSRMFLVTISYYCLKNIDSCLEYSLASIAWEPYQYLATVAMNNFRSSNYEYFFKYFVDFYWGACLVLAFPYFYYLDYDKSFVYDKYTSLLKSFFSICGILRKRGIYWNRYSKLGLLTIGIKFFYIPYLTSWVINNTIHQKNLTNTFQWDLYTFNGYLVALFIYVDTIIYAIGYIVESKYLKNEIKTVEPSILGWIVCLWCYPPFNVFSFRIFDYQIVNIAREYPHWVHAIMTCLISLIWGIFAWASLSLGFKASNLTNRGIIKSGPYRFVRHPAYASKLFLWLIQGIIFGQYGLGILMGFILIYILRAWTEENHLSNDPDYIKYKKIVCWKFIPGII